MASLAALGLRVSRAGGLFSSPPRASTAVRVALCAAAGLTTAFDIRLSSEPSRSHARANSATAASTDFSEYALPLEYPAALPCGDGAAVAVAGAARQAVKSSASSPPPLTCISSSRAHLSRGARMHSGANESARFEPWGLSASWGLVQLGEARDQPRSPSLLRRADRRIHGEYVNT